MKNQKMRKIQNGDHEYEIIDFIGSGAFGRCFLAQTEKKENVVIKMMKMSFSAMNEATVHRGLDHKHIVKFIDSFQIHNFMFLILEPCPNSSLGELLKIRSTLSLYETRYFTYQILCGLKYIHAMNVTHRDLKPDNVLIHWNTQVKIADFGLAREMKFETKGRLQSESFCGTIKYSAPEIFEQRRFSEKSDMWAFGVMCYELLNGKGPFDAKLYEFLDDDIELCTGARTDVFCRAMNNAIARTDTIRLLEDADIAYGHFLLKLFAKDSNERPTTTDCLKMSFYTSHFIPTALPIAIFSRAIFSQTQVKTEHQLKILAKNTTDNTTFSMLSDIIDTNPRTSLCSHDMTYDAVNTESNYITKIDDLLEHLNTIRHLQTNEPFADEFDNFICKLASAKASKEGIGPDHWITEWFFEMPQGFIYRMSDGSLNMIFNSELNMKLHFKQLYRDKNEWVMDINTGKFRRCLDGEYENQLAIFDDFSQELNGRSDASLSGSYETPNERTHLSLDASGNMTHIIKWFRTPEVMLMMLSDGLIQIDFNKHDEREAASKIVLLNPVKEFVAVAENVEEIKFEVKTIEALMLTPWRMPLTPDIFDCITAVINEISWDLKTAD